MIRSTRAPNRFVNGRLLSYLELAVPHLVPLINDLDIYLFGAGGSGESFLQMFPRIHPDAYLDNNSALWGTEIGSIPILGPSALASADAEKSLIFITSDYRKEIEAQLRALGFSLAQHSLAGRPAPLTFDDLHPVFFPSFDVAFDELTRVSSSSDEIVVLRDFAEFPCEGAGDIDVLAKREAAKSLLSSPYVVAESGQSFRVDVEIYEEPTRPWHPTKLKQKVLRNPVFHSNVWRPAPKSFAASFAYHVVVHKSPLWTGIDTHNSELNEDTKYVRQLETVLSELSLEPANLTQASLINFLIAADFVPEIGELQRIAAHQQAGAQHHVALSLWAEQGFSSPATG